MPAGTPTVTLWAWVFGGDVVWTPSIKAGRPMIYLTRAEAWKKRNLAAKGKLGDRGPFLQPGDKPELVEFVPNDVEVEV